MTEGLEDGDQAEDSVEGEGGDGGDVAGAEEGGVREVKEEEGDAGVGEVEGSDLEGKIAFFAAAAVATAAAADRRELVELEDSRLQLHPGEECAAYAAVEETLVGDGEKDE